MVVTAIVSVVVAGAFAQGGFSGPGWYEITNLKSGKSLALAPDLRSVVQMAPGETEGQAWIVDPGPGGTFYIRNGVNGNALQPTSGGKSAPVVTAPFDGRQLGQQWRFQPGKDGLAMIVNYYGRVLDIPDGTSRNGAVVQIYDNNGDSNQRFTLRPMRGEYGRRWRRPDRDRR